VHKFSFINSALSTYMLTSAAAQNPAEENPSFTASQCSCTPGAGAPSLAHVDRMAARSNWSGRPPAAESLTRLNASKAAAAAAAAAAGLFDRPIGVEAPEQTRLVEQVGARFRCHGPSAGCSYIRFRQTKKESEKSRKKASKNQWARMDHVISQSEAL
jgi:hypothetical protein